MAKMEDISSGARTLFRDFPQFFEVDHGPLNTLTIRLPHPLVSASTVGVYVVDTSVDPAVTTSTNAWQLDERNGLLKLTDNTALGKRVLVTGYYFNWFLDSDLDFFSNQVWGEMSYYDDFTLLGLDDAQVEVVQLGAVVHALWSLSIELALDIDVSTPEGMFIPARQRFAQVTQMMQAYEAQYTSKASMMNMGLGGLTQFTLRRVAYLTNRYVPVYKNREVDEHGPPQRIYPPIPDGTAGGDHAVNTIAGVLGVSTVEEVGRSGQDIGWYSIGTSGDG